MQIISIKMFGGRDWGRKAKAMKMTAGQPGSGSPWSIFEDQFLVVLVHDLGPNWELVSDAISTSLQVKCIIRNSKECKERHKFLLYGADSAEDSGSSQPYRTTLPGIPKGCARRLFQLMQGPVEEKMIMSHFEKIRLIREKQLHRRSQDELKMLESKLMECYISSHTSRNKVAEDLGLLTSRQAATSTSCNDVSCLTQIQNNVQEATDVLRRTHL